MKFSGKVFLILVLGFLLVVPTTMAWTANGTPICTEDDYQYLRSMCPDSSGGAILAWDDDRVGLGQDLYVQRVDGSGNVQWTTGGIPVCTAVDDQDKADIASDTSGNSYLAWEDGRRGSYPDIYVQKLNSAGVSQWDANGTVICDHTASKEKVQIIHDGEGGAILVWVDSRSGPTDENIFAQKLYSNGATLWGDNGTAICTEANTQFEPQLCSDGAGGAIIVWRDDRNSNIPDVYIQRLDTDGNPQWGDNGTAVVQAAGWQFEPQIICDGAGGAIVVWADDRGSDYDIYTQKFFSNGAPLWGVNGKAVCTAIGDQREPKLISDGAGGAIVVWADERDAELRDVYAQKMDVNGIPQWTANGTAVCTVSDYTVLDPQICSDGSGGAIIAWQDNRTGERDIYAQILNSAGASQLDTNGRAICTAANNQFSLKIVCDGNGGAILAWADERTSAEWDIYAYGYSPSAGGIPGFTLLYLITGLLAIISIYQQKRNH